MHLHASFPSQGLHYRDQQLAQEGEYGKGPAQNVVRGNDPEPRQPEHGQHDDDLVDARVECSAELGRDVVLAGDVAVDPIGGEDDRECKRHPARLGADEDLGAHDEQEQ